MLVDDEPGSQDTSVVATFHPGDGASLWLGGDAYPMTVRRVSPTGAVVWTSEDRFRPRPGGGSMYDDPVIVGLHIPEAVAPSMWRVFTRRADGAYRLRGSKSGCKLVPGRTYRRDPCL